MGLSDDDFFVRMDGAAGISDKYYYSLHYAGNRKGMDAGTKDFSFMVSTNLGARVESKLEKALGKKISR